MIVMAKVYITTDFRMDMLGVNLESAELRITPTTVEEIRQVQEENKFYTNLTDYYEKQLVEAATGFPLVVSEDRSTPKLRIYAGDVVYVAQFIYTGHSQYHGSVIKTTCNWNASLNDPEFRDYCPYYRKIEVLTKKGILR